MARNWMFAALLAFPMAALAQQAVGAGASPAVAPVKLVLNCPAGTRQMGGRDTVLEATLCAKLAKDGNRVLHGPYVVQFGNGQKQAEGQYENNFRSGTWTFYDEAGVKLGETHFTRGNYDGARVEYWPSGQKKLEEQYVAGKRQGAQKTWSAEGKLSVVEYRDDKPLAQR